MQEEGQGLRSADQVAKLCEALLGLQEQVLVWHLGVCVYLHERAQMSFGMSSCAHV